VIERGEVISYRGLSDAYEQKMGKRIHWRNWAPTLDVLGDWSCSLGLPTIAAVVVNAHENMPGQRFFHPSRASRSLLRKRWAQLLKRVFEVEWPQTMAAGGAGQEQEK
jgi:hypothetical protein